MALVASVFDGSGLITAYTGLEGETWSNPLSGAGGADFTRTPAARIRPASAAPAIAVPNLGTGYRPHWVRLDGFLETENGDATGIVLRADFAVYNWYEISYNATNSGGRVGCFKITGGAPSTVSTVTGVSPPTDGKYAIWVHDQGTQIDVYFEKEGTRTFMFTVSSPDYGSNWGIGVYCSPIAPSDSVGNHINAIAVADSIVYGDLDGTSPLALPPLGVMGDSGLDEYEDIGRGGPEVRNAVEILGGRGLSSPQRIDFGVWSDVDRPEPRNGGFEYNAARNSARAANIPTNYVGPAGVTSGPQAPVIRELVAKGLLDTAFLRIGANDFGPFGYVTDGWIQIYNGTFTDPALATKQQQWADNVIEGIREIREAYGSAKIVWSQYAPPGNDPGAAAAFPNAAQRDAADQALLDAYALVEAEFASDPNVIAVREWDDWVVPAGILTDYPSWVVAGNTISLTTFCDDTCLVLADEVHLGTVGQGSFADLLIVKALNDNFGFSVSRLTDAEIVENAGLTAGSGSVTVTPSGAASVAAAAEAAITQNHTLVPAGAAAISVAASATVTQEHIVTVDGAVSILAAAGATISQSHFLTPAGAATAPVASGVTLTQDHVLVAAGAASVSATAETTLSQDHVLTAAGAATAPVAAEASLTQAHILSPSGAAAVSVAGEGGVTISGDVYTLTPAGAASTSVAAEAAISQDHALTARGGATAPVAATATLTQNHTLTPAGAVVVPVAAEGSVTISGDVYTLSAADAVSTTAAAEATIGQNHVLAPSGAVTNTVAAAATLTQVHLLTPAGVVVVPVAAEATLATDAYAFAPVGAVSTAVAAEATLTQSHVLTPSGAAAAAVADEATLAQLYVLTSSGAATVAVAAEGTISDASEIPATLSGTLDPAYTIAGTLDAAYTLSASITIP